MSDQEDAAYRSRANARLAAAFDQVEWAPAPEVPPATVSQPLYGYSWTDIPPAAWHLPPADLPDGVEPVRCVRCTALNTPGGPCHWCGLD